jgi:threonine synthase
MGFEDAALTGLAPDGGLLIPDAIPDARPWLAGWSSLRYAELAYQVLRLYADLSDEILRPLVEQSYAGFRHPDTAPTVEAGPVYILELFHGPTLAFKDFALQFLGRLFESVLERRDQRLNILGATSGDTGSAAIHSVRGRDRLRVFMMHPRGRVAPVQERQMTSVLDDNVFNLAVEGTFDDCQNIMKGIFRDLPFKQRYALGAVNSVNWARVAAQVVYYFYAAFRVMQATGADRVRFAVPTGNFGDILAGWYARQMGLPIDRLVLATNENDILARFFCTGEYRQGDVVRTLSPSMDIQVASNFERFLFYQLDCDPERLRETMDAFAHTGSLTVPGPIDDAVVAGVGTRDQTIATIRAYHARHGVVVDPHTAVGIAVGERFLEEGVPLICLATAHPAKFSEAIHEAIGETARHEILNGLLDAPARCTNVANDVDVVKQFIAGHLNG